MNDQVVDLSQSIDLEEHDDKSSPAPKPQTAAVPQTPVQKQDDTQPMITPRNAPQKPTVPPTSGVAKPPVGQVGQSMSDPAQPVQPFQDDMAQQAPAVSSSPVLSGSNVAGNLSDQTQQTLSSQPVTTDTPSNVMPSSPVDISVAEDDQNAATQSDISQALPDDVAAAAPAPSSITEDATLPDTPVFPAIESEDVKPEPIDAVPAPSSPLPESVNSAQQISPVTSDLPEAIKDEIGDTPLDGSSLTSNSPTVVATEPVPSLESLDTSGTSQMTPTVTIETSAPPVTAPGIAEPALSQPAEVAGQDDELKKMHEPVFVMPERQEMGQVVPVKVKVGPVPHPMAQDHYIQSIELFDGDKSIGKKIFSPGVDLAAEADFQVALAEGMNLRAEVVCNMHGKWDAVQAVGKTM